MVWLLVAACVAGSLAAPAQLCTAAAENDPRAARFCQALNTFLELSGSRLPSAPGQRHEATGRRALVLALRAQALTSGVTTSVTATRPPRATHSDPIYYPNMNIEGHAQNNVKPGFHQGADMR
ncbi:unnamed protein product [Leptidea sinapis]|uniref:Uncharacterized protein n=1 Tax=Leptidea sinapis TaxID=189913 RepID=A0A5E4Q6L7_9NEOP|nr:unnamed protein product [Leptidea sinapis]